MVPPPFRPFSRPCFRNLAVNLPCFRIISVGKACLVQQPASRCDILVWPLTCFLDYLRHNRCLCRRYLFIFTSVVVYLSWPLPCFLHYVLRRFVLRRRICFQARSGIPVLLGSSSDFSTTFLILLVLFDGYVVVVKKKASSNLSDTDRRSTQRHKHTRAEPTLLRTKPNE